VNKTSPLPGASRFTLNSVVSTASPGVAPEGPDA
jgi:hypothetical protein